MAPFRNPAAAPYWAPRSGSELEVPSGTSVLYTAPASDWYGVVVWNNDDGSPGSYILRVGPEPYNLTDGICTSQSSSPRMFGFAQYPPCWAVAAVNPSGSDDKDIQVHWDPGGVGTPLASSEEFSGTDFVVGDFNHNAVGRYYPRVKYGNPSAPYVVEWEGGGDQLFVGEDVNGQVIGGGLGDCGLVHPYDVYLTAGQEYRFILLTEGAADTRMALFRNPSNGSYWNGRSGAAFEAGNAQGVSYVAPADDWYGVVVFNNSPDSPAGSYTLRVRPPAYPLSNGICLPAGVTPLTFSFAQTDPYWSAVAVNPSGADDKDVYVYDNPDLLGTPVGYSVGLQGTDFVIGDFNHNPPGSYYAQATQGMGDYVMDWDTHHLLLPDQLVEGTVGGVSGACGVIKVWDLYLEAGTTYEVVATSAGDADLRVSLFRNPASAPFWAARSNAEFEIQANGPAQAYTAPATDFYGLVVFNASPGSRPGNYTLRVNGPTSNVAGEAAEAKPRVAFRNPYRAGETIELRAAADGTPAQVSVYNLHGQIVRTLLGANESIGKIGRQVSWDGRTDAGVRLGAGVYFVRARIGSDVMNRTLVLLR